MLQPAGSAATQAAPASKPVFVPGLYEKESRNSAVRTEGTKSRECLTAADFDAFQRETIARYRELPQFIGMCKLSGSKRTPDGFAFAMDCGIAQTIVSFHFSKDMVRSVADTKVVARPEYSSSILTLSRRIGACTGQASGKAL